MPTLFDPIRVGDLTLPHRIAMAPLTRNRAGAGNVPTPLNATYYAQRASAALIVSEATPVCAEGHGYPATPGMHDDAQQAGWRPVTEAVHAAGGRIFLQLWHVGRISHPSLQPGGALPVAPSALRPAGQAFTYQGLQDFVTPRALAAAELPGVVAAFAQAARRAMAAGFDGVEVHGANGYLLDQFLRSSTNRRDDAWGGSIEKRARLLLEVVDAVVAACGAGRVGVRISPENSFNDIGDENPDATFAHVARELGRRRIAYLHVLEGDMAAPPGTPRKVDYAALKRAFGGVYMANNGYVRATAMTAVEQGRADLVAFGRDFLANPDLPERLRRTAPLNAPDGATFYGGAEKGYTDYPTLGG